ncbi:MAG: hypothetical protein WC837_04370 [Bellilinea sp.]
MIQLNNPDLSWRVFTWMEATGWKHLPSALMDEPDWLMDDLFTLASELEVIKNANKKPV